MKYSTIKPEKGIGLIEVLVTTVVVAVGLLAVASLQGTFVSSSGESKTRSEALVLAEQKLESLKNNVTSTGYNALASGTDSPVGINATFTRTWTITDVTPFTTGAPDRKNISVQVGWDGNGDGDSIDTDEIVNVVTELAWNDPAKASSYAVSNSSGGTSSVASPRQNASEDAASENVIGTGLEIIDLVPATAGSAGIDSTVSVTPPSNGGHSITLTQVAAGSHYYTATHSELDSIETGVIAVFLCGDDNTCTHIQNHFGGVVHRIAGTVHSTSSNGFTNIKVAWTSSSVSDCYNGPITNIHTSGTSQYRTRPYECVYAGNCDATADNVNGCTYGVTDAQILRKNVGPGGEYGDVGLLGVDDQGGDREQVCFLEDTVNPATSPLLTASGGAVLNEDYLYSVTKRFYSARRIKRNGSINDQKSEGINHSYTNHNFLVVSRGTGATANQVCNLKAATPYTGYSSLQLAPREIFKTLDEGVNNTAVAETAYAGTAGTAKTLTGNVTGSRTDLKLIIPDLGNCYLNNNSSGGTATAYACAVPSDTVSVDIKGGSDEHPSLNPSVFASCTKTDATTCHWPANFTASATPSDDCTTPWNATAANGSTVTAYQNETEAYNGTEECTTTLHESRTCSSGDWSPSAFTYTYQTCQPAQSRDCAAPWGGTITNGSPPVEAYLTSSVPYGYTCTRSDLTCTNGILSGDGLFNDCDAQSTRDILVTTESTGTGSVSGVSVSGTGATCVGMTCTVDNAWTGSLTATGTCSGSPASVSASVAVASTLATSANITFPTCAGPVCTTPWSSSVASGGSVTAYLASSAITCTSEARYCNDGVLSGTYTNQSCTVIPTYSITATAANGSGSVTSTTCGGGTCSGLVAGTYSVAVTLSGGNTCSKSYTITTANRAVTVTKGSGGSTTCTMAP